MSEHRPSQPLRLANGSIVMPDGRVIQQYSNSPTDLPTINDEVNVDGLTIQAKRKLSELVESPKTMNAISVIIAYSLFGLGDEDIASATGLDEVQILKLRKSDAYTSMRDAIVQSVMNAEQEHVRGIFQKNARKAATVLVDTLNSGTRPERLTVARDLLDRAGHRPSDVVEHRHRMDGGLTIEIIRRDSQDKSPVIDMTLEEEID